MTVAGWVWRFRQGFRLPQNLVHIALLYFHYKRQPENHISVFRLPFVARQNHTNTNRACGFATHAVCQSSTKVRVRACGTSPTHRLIGISDLSRYSCSHHPHSKHKGSLKTVFPTFRLPHSHQTTSVLSHNHYPAPRPQETHSLPPQAHGAGRAVQKPPCQSPPHSAPTPRPCSPHKHRLACQK